MSGPGQDRAPGGSGYGRATVVLALLAGTIVERAALGLPGRGLELFHVAVAVGIAFLVARAYRAFARRAIARRRGRDEGAD